MIELPRQQGNKVILLEVHVPYGILTVRATALDILRDERTYCF